MSVRAKFTCEAIEPDTDGAGATIRMSPVITGSAENEQFFKYTPGGQLVLSTVNQAAVEQFAVGKSFYVDISPAEQEEAPPDPPQAA